jgi:TPP-dependent pyruvate/acetoin dehydrogenase alpha subunit
MKVAEQQALLESLSKKKAELDSRIARLEARKEADQRQWAQKSAELKEQFGTDNLMKIKAILEKEKAENEAKLLACQSQLDDAMRRVVEMENALADLDADTVSPAAMSRTA